MLYSLCVHSIAAAVEPALVEHEVVVAAVAVEAVVADLAGAAQREHSEVVNSLVMAVYREEPRPVVEQKVTFLKEKTPGRAAVPLVGQRMDREVP